jgi:capping protein (actin filament) muscle Z-line, alpha
VSQATVEASSPSNQDQSLEGERVALQAALDAYVRTRYVAEDSAAGVFARDGKLVAIVAGEKPNLRNFWSGKWTSTWNISTAGGQATVTGEIKIHAHYFEDGNVQLQTSKPLPARIFPFSSESDFAEQISAYISVSYSHHSPTCFCHSYSS